MTVTAIAKKGRPASAAPTLGEVQVLRTLWAVAPSGLTVAAVVSMLNRKRRRRHYNTVLTTLRVMEQKGFVRRKRVGRADLYIARWTRERALSTALQEIERAYDVDAIRYYSRGLLLG